MILSNSAVNSNTLHRIFARLLVLLFGLGFGQFAIANCINITSPAPTVSEGGSVAIIVEFDLDNTPLCGDGVLVSEFIRVEYSTSDGSASGNSDYVAEPNGVIVFDEFNFFEPQIITLETTNDSVAEPIESFNLTLTSAMASGFGSLPIGNGTQTITIEDNEFARIDFDPNGPFFGSEGSSVNVTTSVTLGNPNVTCSFDFRTVVGTGTAVAGEDYVAIDQTISLPFGESQTIPIQLLTDSNVELTETFNVHRFSPSAGCVIGSVAQQVMILDVPPDPTVQFQTTSLTLVEGESSNLQIEMTEGSGFCEVDVIGIGGSADVELDYDFIFIEGVAVGPSGTPFPVDAFADDLLEGTEDYSIQIIPGTTGASSFEACDIGNNATATVTIIDLPPRAEFTVSSETVSEGATTISLGLAEVSGLSVPGSCNVDVTTVSGSGAGIATSGTDYAPLTQTLNIPIGGTASVPPILVLMDTDSPESPNETFIVEIAPSANAPCEVTVNNTATVEILDVAPPTPPTVEFGLDFAALQEGDTFAQPIVMTQGSDFCEVDIVVFGGNAQEGADYSFDIKEGIAVGPAGSNYIISTVADILAEGNEGITLQLVPGTTGVTSLEACEIGALEFTEHTIIDSPPIAQFSIDNESVSEGSTTISLQVAEVSGLDLSGSCNVDITTVAESGAGIATSGQDYAALTQTVSIPIGGTAAVPPIQVLTDTVSPETTPNEIFNLVIAPSASAPCEVGGNSTATVEILDVAPPEPPTVQFANTTASAQEGGGSVFEILHVAGTFACDVDVVTSDVSASAGADYTPITTTVTVFPPSFSLPATVLAVDAEVEGDETFEILLAPGTNPNSSFSSCAIAPGGELAEQTIVDVPPRAEFSVASETVSEGATTVSLEIAEVSGLAGPGSCNVDVVTLAGSAQPGEDYVPLTQTLSIPLGETLAVPAISVLVDTDTPELPNELFTLQITPSANAPCAVTVNNIASVEILDVEPPETPTVQFANTTASAQEGGGSVFEILHVAGTFACDVDVVSSDVSASAGADYTPITTTVTVFPPSFSLPATVLAVDAEVEGDETFEILLAPGTNPNSSFSSCAISPGGELAEQTIVDVPPRAEFSVASETVSEGATTISLEIAEVSGLAGPGSCDVDVTTLTGSGTATSGVDYVPLTQTISIPIGSTALVPAIMVLEDAESPESPNETFIVEIAPSASSPCAVTINNTATVTIEDVAPPVQPTVQFVSLAESALEGSGSVFEIEHVAGTGSCEVTVTAMGGTAEIEIDYTPVAQTILVSPGGTTSLPVTELLADAEIEGGETFNIVMTPGSLGAPSAPSCAITPMRDIAVQTIEDLPPQAEFLGTTLTVSEGETTITLAVGEVSGIDFTGTCDVDVFTQAGTGSALAGIDYTPLELTTLTVPIGGSVAVPEISVLTDDVSPEFPNEDFFVEIIPSTSSANPCAVSFNNVATIDIEDVIPPATVQFTTASTSISGVEGSTVNLELELIAGVGPASVIVSTTDMSAIAPGDYTMIAAESFSFPSTAVAGDTLTVPVTLAMDTETEDSEEFQVSLTAVSGTLLGTNVQSTVIITDDPVPTIEFASGSTTVSTPEDGGSVTLTLEMTAGNGPGTVLLETTDGLAMAGSDYTALASGFSVTFPDSAVVGSTQTITIPILEDMDVEGDEVFTVSILGTSSANAGINNLSTIEIVDVVQPTIQFAMASTSTNGLEGSTVNLELELIAGVGPASVSVSTVDMSAIAPDDYTAIAAQTFTFPMGAVAGDILTVPVTLAMDTETEGSEEFLLTLAALGDTLLGTNVEATVVITDEPVPTIEFASGSSTVSTPEDGGSVTLTLEMTAGNGPGTVLVETTDGLAVAGSDYTALANGFSVTFPDSAVVGSTQTITIPILEDMEVEGDEVFTVSILGTSSANAGINNLSTIEILDIVQPTVQFTTASTSISGVEGSTLNLELELIAGVGPASVSVSTADLSANAPDDYTAIAAQTFTFPMGAVAGDTLTVPLELAMDTETEVSEEFQVNLAALGNTLLGTNVQSTVIITDDPVPTIEFASGSGTVTTTEDGGSVTLTLEMTAGNGPGTVLVETTDGLAMAGLDYTALPGGFSVTFPDSAVVGSTQTINIPILEDMEVEGDEVFTASILGTPTANAGINNLSTIEILDVVQPTVQFTMASTSTNGPEGSTVNLELELLAGAGPASVSVSTVDMSAIAPDDYTAINAQTFSFAADAVAGDTLIVPVTLAMDTETEGSEQFQVNLAALGNTLLGTNASSTVFITDEPVPTIEFTSASTMVSTPENGGSITLTLEMTAEGGSGMSTVLVATTDGTATAGSDYTALTNGFSITFPETAVVGSTQTITIPILEDMEVEGDEVFTVNILGTPSANAGANDLATIEILDIVQPTVQFTTASTSISGVEGSTLNLELELIAGVGPASVSVSTADVSAVAPGDYTAIAAQTFNFPPTAVAGDTLIVPLTLAMDTETEVSEEFEVNLTALGSTQLGSNIQSTVFITDDPVPTIEFASASTNISAPEDGGSITLTLEMTAGNGPGTVLVATTDGVATAGADYTALAGGFSVSFPATAAVGSTETITIPILPDTEVEGDEDFTVSISGTSSANAGVNDVSTINILDVVQPTVQFTTASTSASGLEGTTVNLELELIAGVGPASITVSTTDVTAIAPGDYTAVAAQTFSFPPAAVAGDTMLVPFELAMDTETEGSEEFQVTLAAGPGTLLGTNVQSSITITDDPLPTIEFASASINVSTPEDSGSVTLTLEMTAEGGPGMSTVIVATTDDTATAGSDFTPLTGGFSITFPETAVVGSTQTVTIPILADNVVEGDEVFTVSILGTPSANAGTNNLAMIEILDVVLPTVQFTTASTSVSGVEGNIVNLELELVAGAGPASVSVSTADITAIAPGDYTAIAAQTVNFPADAVAGDTLLIPLTLASDTETEVSEEFQVNLAAIGDSLLGANIVSTVFITDDPVPTIEFASVSTTVNASEEIGSISLTLEMTAGDGSATVFVATTDGTATAGEDYTALPGGFSVSFPATAVVGSTETITIPILTDMDIEIDEVFTASISGTSSANAGINDVSIITITDSTPMPPIVEFAPGQTTLTVDEDGVVQVLAVVVTSGETPATVNVNTVSGTATPPDFTPVAETLTFAAGVATQSIAIPINTDDLLESNESFTVVLTPVESSTTLIGDNDTVSITIVDTTPIPTVQFAATSTSINTSEDAGSASVTIELVAGTGPVSVDVATIDGTALSGADFGAIAQTITIPAGATSVDFSIPISPDSLIEGAESFTVGLAIPEGENVELGANATSTVSIADTTVPGVVEFAASSLNVSVAEDEASITLDLIITGTPVASSVDVMLTDGTADSPADFNATVQTVVFADGVAANSVSIPINADLLIEDPESFTATLVPTPGSGTLIGTNSVSTITIIDSTVLPPTVEIAAASTSLTVDENDSLVTLLLELTSGIAPATVQVNTIDGSAASPADFTGFSQMVTIEEGQTQVEVSIEIAADAELEDAETFTVQLSEVSGNNTLVGVGNSATISIVDTTSPASVAFSTESTNVTVAEADGSITLELVLSGTPLAASVDAIITAGSATASEDFVADTQTIAFLAGETAQQVIIQINTDDLIEDVENFTVTLTPTPGSGTEIGSNNVSTVSITDSTVLPPTVAFAAASTSVTVDESAGATTLTLVVTEGVGPATVNVTTVNGSASSDGNSNDFDAISQVLTIPAGVTSAEITIDINSDAEIEEVETFTVELSAANGTTQIADPATSTITIVDSTVPGVVEFAESSLFVSAQENAGSVTLELELSGTPVAASVDVILSNAGATAGEDFVGATQTVSFAEGATSATVTIEINDDDSVEGSEVFSATLSPTPGSGTITGDNDVAEITIVDTTILGPTVQIASSSTSVTVEEALGAAVINLEVIAGNVPGSVLITAFTDSATAGEDFAANSIVVEVPANAEVISVSIPIVADNELETTEQFTVTLTANDAVTLIGSNASSTITIPEQTANPGIIQFVVTEIAAEENDGLARLQVSRTGGSDLRVSADYTFIDGTAVAGEDYIANNGQVVWEAGDLEPREIVIELINDNGPEETEQFAVQLVNASPIGDESQFRLNRIAQVVITDSDTQLALNDDIVVESPFRVEVVGPTEQNAELGDDVNLSFQIRDSRLDNAAVSGLPVLWSVEPAGAVEFPDGAVTISDSEGFASNRIVVTGTGFIRIIAEAQFDTTTAQSLKGQPQLTTRIDTPAFDVPIGSAFFTLRVGLETAPGLTENQSQTGMGLDNACLELNGVANIDTLEGNVNDAGEMLSAEAQQDLIDTCTELEMSENLSADLDRVAHEELFVLSDTIVDTADIQVTNVYSRINALRSNNIERLDLSGLNLSFLDETIPGSVVNAAQNALYGLASGGGAAADGGGFGSRLGFFANGAIGFGEVDGQGQQQDADVRTTGLTIGADYRFTDQFVLGAGLGFVDSETDFGGSEGGAEVDGLSFTLFGTWFNPNVGYLDVVLDAGNNSYDIERQINLTTEENEVMAIGETDADYVALTIGAGRNFRLSKWELGPYIRYSATRATVDGYSERSSSEEAGFGSVLDVRGHDASSSLFTFGGQISTNISTKRAVFVPQFRFEFETQTEETRDGIPATFQADPNDTLFILEGTERDTSYINYGIGSSVVMKGGHSGFLFIEGRAADDIVRQNFLKLGYRYEFR